AALRRQSVHDVHRGPVPGPLRARPGGGVQRGRIPVPLRTPGRGDRPKAARQRPVPSAVQRATRGLGRGRARVRRAAGPERRVQGRDQARPGVLGRAVVPAAARHGGAGGRRAARPVAGDLRREPGLGRGGVREERREAHHRAHQPPRHPRLLPQHHGPSGFGHRGGGAGASRPAIRPLPLPSDGGRPGAEAGAAPAAHRAHAGGGHARPARARDRRGELALRVQPHRRAGLRGLDRLRVPARRSDRRRPRLVRPLPRL
ncbi:MAG: Hydroxypyruvate isomerase, partial [uncultured Acetobacteraceae bacterium]